MRVLHLITSLDTGGAEASLVKLLGAMNQREFEPRVVSLLPPGPMGRRLEELNIHPDHLAMSRGFPTPAALARLVGILRQFRPQVVQAWLYHADLLGLAAARLAGLGHQRLPVVWNVRAAYMDFRRYRRLTRLVVGACAALSGGPEAVVFNSQAGQTHHLALGYRPRRTEIIANGFDTAHFRPDTQTRAAVRVELGLGQQTPVAGLMARYDAMKDFPTFCRAAALARQQLPELRLVLCGQAVTPDNPELAALLADHNLEEAALLLGRREDLPRILASLDLLVLSSSGESFPNVVGEAMACGLPVVATDVGDVGLILGRDGDLGRVVPARQPEALARAMVEVLTLPAADRAAMGTRARERIASHYSLEAVAAAYARLYRELANPGA